jgi:hypothetical protein
MLLAPFSSRISSIAKISRNVVNLPEVEARLGRIPRYGGLTPVYKAWFAKTDFESKKLRG